MPASSALNRLTHPPELHCVSVSYSTSTIPKVLYLI